MSTPEQPQAPQLTRKQLREIRNTGSTPVIDAGATPATAQKVAPWPADNAPVAPPPVEVSLPPVAPLARPAEPVVLPEPPVPDRAVDLGVAPLTRRQARQQERIRTASVPVITPDIAAAYAAQASVPTDVAPIFSPAEASPERRVEPATVVVDDSPRDGAVEDPFAALGVHSGSAPIVLPEETQPERAATTGPERLQETAPEPEWPFPADESEPEAPRVVDPSFGAALLSGEGAPAPALPPSFDELIARSGNGSTATPNALILSQVPDAGPIVAPVTSTGEVLITGTLNLPEGLGSTGHAPGTTDGKEVDAVLVDGELPAHSSPTPIAASSAVSTVKTPGEIIRPPAPEKGGRLMLTLAITAGVLALALVGVLILAFATGVF